MICCYTSVCRLLGTLFDDAYSVTRLRSVGDMVVSVMNGKGFGRTLLWPHFKVLYRHSPGGTEENNVMVQWLIFLLRFLEVPSSNLGPGDWLSLLRFSWFYSLPPECRNSTLNEATIASYQTLSHSSSSTYYHITDAI
jgi:hypothetical protein